MGGWRFASFFALAFAAIAQPALHFRGLGNKAASPPDSSVLAGVHRIGTYRHVLVEFEHRPTAEDLRALQEKGARLVQYVPDSGYFLAIPDWVSAREMAASNPHILQVDEVPVQQKLSALLDTTVSRDMFALVEFYPDVDMGIARTIVLLAQLEIQENTNLLDHDLLVHGKADALAVLAGWDEVSYVFPASDDLVQGVPLNGCAGALTDLGLIGQSIATVPFAWAGPGLNAVDLYYAFKNVTDKIPADTAKAELVRAFNEWAKYVQVTFTPSSDTAGARTITVLFASGPHGDGYPFDGPGGVLAHTFYPYPTNAEPLAGDMHLDADESWHAGSSVDLFSVALHETGHALGLGHSDQPNAVMYPYYKSVSALTKEDINAALTLYPSATAAPLTLTIQSPGSTTKAPYVSLNGSVSGGTGSATVNWSANGFSGTASGSPTWTVPAIPLNTGANTITVTATDAQLNSVVQTVGITRQQTITPPASVPVLAITSPAASGIYTTTSASVSLSGTASDSSGVSEVKWSSSQGASGMASGTANWTIGALTLASGSTTFNVTAYAKSGAQASQTLQIVYTPPATAGPPPTTPVTPANPPVGTAAPSLAILSPATNTLTTSASSLGISGTAQGANGIGAVTWSTSNGDSGTALGTDTWAAPPIPLLVGTTTVVVTARDNTGATAWRSIVVTRR